MDLSIIDEAKVFHFGSLSQTDEPARSATKQVVLYAKEKGKLITYDPNLRRPLWKDLEEAKVQMLWGLMQADVVKISDEEVEFLFGMEPEAGAEHISHTFGAKLVFVTCGAKGCYYRNQHAAGFVPALAGVCAVDTTGAGDIFGGSAVYALLRAGVAPQELGKAQLDAIVIFACAAAGLSTEAYGGISSVPEIERVLAAIGRKEEAHED